MCSPNNSAFFTNFIKFSSFSRPCAPVVVSTTHPGLPSPPTINWPPIPPACWPSTTFRPTSHRFLSISHPICSVWVWQTPHWTPSACLCSMCSSIHPSIHPSIHLSGVSSITEIWGRKLLCYLLCLQGSDTEEKESRPSVTSSPNDKQIDLALWLWQSKQG